VLRNLPVIKSNLSATLIFLFLAGCHSNQTTPIHPTQLHKWEAANVAVEPTTRSIAQVPQTNPTTNQSCSNFYSKVNLSAIILKLEKTRVQELFSKSSELNPNRQLYDYFLEHNRSYIARMPDQAQCSNVACLYDSFYGHGSIESLYAYIWWLRTGSVLAVSDSIPDLNTNTVKGTFKFLSSELRDFAKLALMTTEFKDLKTLNAIYRLPPKTEWTDTLGRPLLQCGLASSKGWIEFSDHCMADSTLESAVHELAHHLDYSKSYDLSESSSGYGISGENEWLALSGWHIKEVKDPTTGQTIERRWATDKSKEKFVTVYAGSSPHEDWAESTSYFRINAKVGEASAPSKMNYVSKIAFHGSRYDEASLLSQLSAKIFNSFQDRFIEETLTCMPADGLTVSQLTVRKCLDQLIHNYATHGIDFMTSVNPEACLLFQNNQTALTSLVTDNFTMQIAASTGNFSTFISKNIARRDLAQELQKLDLAAIYSSCLNDNSPKDCYMSQLQQAVRAKIRPEWRPFSEILKETIDNFIVKNTFDDAGIQTRERYRRMFDNSSKGVKLLAETAWRKCSNAAPKSGSESFYFLPASAGTDIEYVRPSIKNCLTNEAQVGLIRTLNASVNQSFQVTDEPTKTFLIKEFSSDFWRSISPLIQASRAGEKLKIKALHDLTLKALPPELISDSTWIREALPIFNSCLGTVKLKIRNNFPIGVIDGLNSLKFSPVEETLQNFTEEVCSVVSTSDRLKILFSGSPTERANASADFLRQAVVERAKFYMNNCRAGSTGIGQLLEKLELVSAKTACALNNSKSIAEEAFAQWKKSPYGQKMGSDTSRLWRYLLQNVTAMIKSATDK
jgi:hypothetical protein